MLITNWKVDHIGIACRDIVQAINDYEKLGFRRIHEDIHEGQTQKVKVQFMILGETVIELLAPLDKEDRCNPLNSYIKTPNYKMYHLCYKVDDLDNAISYLQECGYRMIGTIFPDSMHNHRKLVFMYHRMGGVIELAE